MPRSRNQFNSFRSPLQYRQNVSFLSAQDLIDKKYIDDLITTLRDKSENLSSQLPNNQFNLSDFALQGSLAVYVDGVKQLSSTVNGSGSSFTLSSVVPAGSVIVARYTGDVILDPRYSDVAVTKYSVDNPIYEEDPDFRTLVFDPVSDSTVRLPDGKVNGQQTFIQVLGSNQLTLEGKIEGESSYVMANPERALDLLWSTDLNTWIVVYGDAGGEEVEPLFTPFKLLQIDTPALTPDQGQVVTGLVKTPTYFNLSNQVQRVGDHQPIITGLTTTLQGFQVGQDLDLSPTMYISPTRPNFTATLAGLAAREEAELALDQGNHIPTASVFSVNSKDWTYWRGLWIPKDDGTDDYLPQWSTLVVKEGLEIRGWKDHTSRFTTLASESNNLLDFSTNSVATGQKVGVSSRGDSNNQRLPDVSGETYILSLRELTIKAANSAFWVYLFTDTGSYYAFGYDPANIANNYAVKYDNLDTSVDTTIPVTLNQASDICLVFSSGGIDTSVDIYKDYSSPVNLTHTISSTSTENLGISVESEKTTVSDVSVTLEGLGLFRMRT